jgi:hypothetical protein
MFQTDGDTLGDTPVEIAIKPGAARFIVPLAYFDNEETTNATRDAGVQQQVVFGTQR